MRLIIKNIEYNPLVWTNVKAMTTSSTHDTKLIK